MRSYRRRRSRRKPPPPPPEPEVEEIQEEEESPGDYDPFAYDGDLVLEQASEGESGSVRRKKSSSAEERLIDEYFQRGYMLLQQGLHKEALSKFLTVLKLNPTDPECNINAGICYAGIGRYEDALDCLLDALGSRSKEVLIWDQLSLVYFKLGDYAEAEEACCYALQYETEYEEAVYLRLGRTLWALKRYNDAAKMLRECLRIAPGNATAHQILGVYGFQRGNFGEASHHFLGATKSEKTAVEAWVGLGKCQTLSGNVKEALASFKQVDDAEHAAAKRWAKFLESAKQLTESCAEKFCPTLVVPEGAAVAILQGGLLLINEGRLPEATSTFSLGLRQFPNSVALGLWQGIALALQGQLDRALEVWGRFEKEASSTPELAALLAIGRATVCQKGAAGGMLRHVPPEWEERVRELIGSCPATITGEISKTAHVASAGFADGGGNVDFADDAFEPAEDLDDGDGLDAREDQSDADDYDEQDDYGDREDERRYDDDDLPEAEPVDDLPEAEAIEDDIAIGEALDVDVDDEMMTVREEAPVPLRKKKVGKKIGKKKSGKKKLPIKKAKVRKSVSSRRER